MRVLLLLFASGVALAVPVGQLRFSPSGPVVRVDAGVTSVTLVKSALDGSALPAGLLGASSASVSASSPTTLFAPSAAGPWSALCAVTFAAGASTSSTCFVTESKLANPLLVGDAGPDFGTAEATLTAMFEEDGSRGTLLGTQTPAGPWDVLYPLVTGNTFSSAAGHRGAGFVFHDGNPSNLANEGAYQYHFLVLQGAVWLRSWLRIDREQLLASMSVLGMEGPPLMAGGDGKSINVFSLGRGIVGMQTGGQITAGHAFDELPDLDGNWHLIEAELGGLGTMQGERRLWFDGVPVFDGGTFDYTHVGVRKVVVGEDLSTNAGFTGDIVYDDLRVQTVPPATRVQFVPGPGLRLPGACDKAPHCVPLGLAVTGPDHAPAVAPDDVQVKAASTNVRGGTAIAFFSQPDCSGSATLTVPQGESSARVGVQITGCAAWSLGGSHDDLLAGDPVVVTVKGDPVELGFPASVTYLQSGACSAELSVEVRDSAHSPTTVRTALPVTLSATGARVFKDAACTQAGDAANLEAGAGAVPFHLLPSGPGPVTVTAVASGNAAATLGLVSVQTTARLVASSLEVRPGATVSLDGSGSLPSEAAFAGQAASLTDSGYAWAARYAPAYLALPGSGAHATVGPFNAAGSYELELRVTDSLHFTGPPARVTVKVSGVQVPASQPTGCGCSGGVGGPSLAAALAVGHVWRRRRRRKR